MTASRFPHAFPVALLCGGLQAGLALAQVNVLTRDYDVRRTGSNLSETQLAVANVTPASFGKLGVFPVDGQVFAQPLYVSGLRIAGQRPRNVLFIATEHNSVYAYDADSAAHPALLWHVNLGPPIPSEAIPSDAETGPFDDVVPEVGILSTGAIDLQTGVLYVVASVYGRGEADFQLHALDLVTGQESMNGPVRISATVTRSDDAPEDIIDFEPGQHIQRPGLLLANNAVYLAFGSHGDHALWHGWLISYDAADLTRQLGVFQTTRDGNGGAIWQSGRGLASDGAGNVYAITGNGDYDGVRNFSQSFLRVSGASVTLSDWYTPANWAELADADYDFSAGPTLLPDGRHLLGADKDGSLYLVKTDSMGHLDTAQSAQVIQASIGFISTFVLWPRTRTDTHIYLRGETGILRVFRASGGELDPEPLSTSWPIGGTGRLGIALSANGTREGTGILWACSGSYLDPSIPTVLHAFDASDLGEELWNSEMIPADRLYGFVKFVPPTVANGKVYAAATDSVVVYGHLARAPK